MSILLTLYLAGMPLAGLILVYSLQGLPDDDWEEVDTATGYVALAVFVLLWPVFAAIAVHDYATGR